MFVEYTGMQHRSTLAIKAARPFLVRCWGILNLTPTTKLSITTSEVVDSIKIII